ncbi:kinesin, putative [Leishmania donovani]|uniref:Kinesin-like protein n=1 Tax=Leishmania donovani TaxID=5661 RepID=A0A3S7X6Y8_LEIDO|nr:kinesin, putative [Leishmania donovani]AYU82207.1 kinesin, putative [Leishmania donovani]TPP53651.1 Kinesin motor domain family protein [Leishmania donovani]CBZ37369.1 kinesin, putative [Leishmania donovani]
MSIEVHVRVRPSVANVVWSSAETVLYSTANPNTRYVYNKVYPSNSTNESIFHGMEAVVHAAFDGKNVTIMAYGQTGSGKTHSMIGVDHDPGMVPRAAKLLLELKRTTPGAKIQAFYTEIYNESVKDLLEPQRGELALHDAPDGGVFFEKKMIDVETFDDFIQLQAAAERNRKYGVTNLNEHSSRSHVILTFEIHRRNRVGKSVINLVDLAGSESASRANTEGISLREGGYINRSLLTLGNVVDAIVERRPYVPYRDAKLTRLLRTCLGGSGITLILCCVNPSRENFDQTVATLRFTQRAMKIKNDPVVVLNMPPLFTHQYSDGARQLIEGLQESAEAEYQRGLRDSFLYCGTTVASVVSNYQTQVSDCLHSLATAQRLLVAHDHAMAIDHIGRLYNQQNDLVRQRISNQELAENERKRQRDVASEIESRKDKIAKLEEELRTKVSSLDTNLAGWEYQLYEARQKQRSEMDVLLQLELARRARIQYEWVVCLERIASRSVPVIQAGLSALQAKLVESASGGSGAAEHQQYRHHLHTILSLQDGDAGSRTLHVKELRAALMKARDELDDLKTAHEMVKDDIEEARRQQQQQDSKRGSASVSPQPRPNVSDLSEEDLVEYYRGVTDSEVEERIHRLEREEKALMAQARRGVRRESLRRVRESLRVSRGSRGGSSRSPQSGGGGVTITRLAETAGAGPGSNASQHFGRSVADEEARAGFLQTEATAQVEARGRRSSASYADGVKNALSILDSLKAQLQRRGGNNHAAPTVASTNRHQQSQSQRQQGPARLRNYRSVSSSSETRRRQGRKGVEETAVYYDPQEGNVGEEHQCAAPRSAAEAAAHRRHHATVSDSADDTENMSLAELYQASMGKENWSRPKPSAAATVSSRAAHKYAAVAEDDAAFDADEEADEGKEDGRPVSHQLTSSPPIEIAARRKMKRQNSRPAVERALYALNSNSHSTSPS